MELRIIQNVSLLSWAAGTLEDAAIYKENEDELR
jgi:hypothetical protein